MSIHPIKRKPNISIVAKQAGVAVSTVSRYLNGHYVSADARSRIAAAIAELGYSRSSTARNLSLGRRGSIGVVVDSEAINQHTRGATGRGSCVGKGRFAPTRQRRASGGLRAK